MPITQSFAVELLAGESLKVAGPGFVEFSAAEVAKTKMGTVVGATTGAKGVAMGGGAATAASPIQIGAGTGKATITTGVNQGTAITTATGSKAAAGTLWNGKGLSLGLGLGLGAWGPFLLVSAATLGGYVYWKRKQSAKLWPF